MKGLIRLANKLSKKHMLKTGSVKIAKRVKKTEKALVKHIVSLYLISISTMVKISGVQKLQRDIENGSNYQ